MRVEPVIAVPATDGVGPTKLQLLTAASAKLPVVVVAGAADAPAYHVYSVASLRAALADQLSATRLADALDLTGQESRPPVSRSEVAATPAGVPVVESGRLIGVTAEDVPDYPEPSEQDMTRGGNAQQQEPGRKRGLWQRLSRSSE